MRSCGGLKAKRINQMSIYHLSVKCISRSNGRTASGSAAYRSGEKIRDNAGDIHDYTRKKGILHTELVLPSDSPYWASDRATLWNYVDKAEKRKDSTVAREYELALPSELNREEQVKLTKEFADYIVKEYGVCADISIHAPREDNNNYHAHVMTSTRILGIEGFNKKTRILDDRTTGRFEVEKIRKIWEVLQNQSLERKGIEERVSCESLAAQGIDRKPQIHLGVSASAMLRKGIRTERSDHNEAIRMKESLKQEEKVNVHPMTHADALAIIKGEMKKIFTKQWGKHNKNIETQIKEFREAIEKAEKDKKENEQTWEDCNVLLKKQSKPERRFLESKSVYDKRLSEWEDLRDKTNNAFNAFIDTQEEMNRLNNEIILLQDPQETEKAKKAIHKHAQVTAMEKHPEAAAVLRAEAAKQTELQAAAEAARQTELRAAEATKRRKEQKPKDLGR